MGNSKVSDFIRDYLTMKTSKIATKDRVYETFKEFANNPNNKYDEQGLLEDLLVFAKYYSDFLYCNSVNNAINCCLEQFQQLKSTTVYPFLLYIFDICYAYKKITEYELVGIMNILISYIFRRLICSYPTNSLSKIFANLTGEIEKAPDVAYQEKLLNILTQKTSSGTFPRNKEFEVEFIQKDLYKSKIDKYTLCTIENYLCKEKVYVSGDITIEHIMPQTLTPQWQIELGKKYEDIHAQYLHTIGNLTISGYNSELSNKSFRDKKEIFKNSNISICRNICDFETWNDESIKQRGKILFDTALKIWNLPEKYNTQKNTANIIDYSTPYSIQTDINITGEKPKQLIICDNEYSISSWKDMLKTTFRVLFEEDNTILYNLIRHKDFSGRGCCIINNSQEHMRSPYKVADGLFVETNLSALGILNYCKILCEHYQISDSVYFLLSKRDNYAQNAT